MGKVAAACAGAWRLELDASGGRRRRVTVGPLHDLARAHDDVAIVEHENRHAALTAELLDLGAVAGAAGQGPELQRSALDLLPVVAVPCLVECFGGTPARMRKWPWQPSERLAVGARVEDHVCKLAPRRAVRRRPVAQAVAATISDISSRRSRLASKTICWRIAPLPRRSRSPMPSSSRSQPSS